MSMRAEPYIMSPEVFTGSEAVIDESTRILDLQRLVLGAGSSLDDFTLQSIIATALTIYVQRFDAGNRAPIVPANARLSATPVLIAATMLMKSENIELFELGMWQTMSGIK